MDAKEQRIERPKAKKGGQNTGSAKILLFEQEKEAHAQEPNRSGSVTSPTSWK
jgi:hypothetical protein